MLMVNLEYQIVKRINLIGLTTLTLGVIGLMVVVWNFRDLSHKITEQEMLVTSFQAKPSSQAISVSNEVRTDENMARETKQVNAAILQLSVPWKDLFDALELSRTNDVAVLAIEPDVKNGVVHISAETKKLDSMLDYAASLQKAPQFKAVLILNHQVQEQDPEKPIRFVIQASWGGLRE